MIDILRVFRPFLVGLAVVLGGLYFFLCIYFSFSVKGYVFEESTGKPIEGVIVVASWSKRKMYALGSINVGLVQVQETLTDKNGQYSFKPWIAITPLGYSINSLRPEVSAAKYGYVPMVIRDAPSSTNDVGQVIENQGNEKLQFFMAPPNGKLGRFGDAAGGISTPLMRKYRHEHHDTGIKK